MIQDPVQLREALMNHSMKHPGSLKEISERIGMSYPALRAFMRSHVRTLNFEHVCKINKYIAEYSPESKDLTTIQICELHNKIRAIHGGTQNTMNTLCEKLNIEDINEIDGSNFNKAMAILKELNPRGE